MDSVQAETVIEKLAGLTDRVDALGVLIGECRMFLEVGCLLGLVVVALLVIRWRSAV